MTPPSERRTPSLAECLAVFLAAAVWMFLLAPEPAYFVNSAETGHQLAGALNLLHFAQSPHVDYVTSYGPGRYWVSAFGLWLAGGGLFGELLTRSAGHAVYLVLLFVVLRRVGASTAMASLLLAAAALALPPGHKYWTALCPILVLYAAQRWCMAGSRRAAFGTGATIGFAALFRPDYGLFALVPGLVAVATGSGAPGTRRRLAGELFAGVLAPLLPWLLLVGANHDLGRFFADWAQVGSAVGSGLGLPHPLLSWTDITLSAAFAFVVGVPLTGLLQCRLAPHATRGLQRFALAVHLFALVNLVQSSHRADWPHLFQGIAPAFVSLAVVLVRGSDGIRSSVLRLAFPLLFAALLLPGRAVAPSRPATAARNWAAAALPKAEFARRHVDATPIGRVAAVARRCLAPANPTAFFPFTPQLHYFAERPFAGGLPFLAPGFFDTVNRQRRAVEQLERERPALLFWAEGFAYDGRADRNSTRTHALVHAYVVSHYQRAGLVDGHTVFRRTGAVMPSPDCDSLPQK